MLLLITAMSMVGRRGDERMLMTEELLAVRAAELYYEEAKTQDEVGALLGVSRWKVGRLLSDAREQGIVRIDIVHPRARRIGVERDVAAAFGLVDAIVVPATLDGSERAERIAQAAADYLTAFRPVPRTLGVSWGRTVHAIATRLPENWSSGTSVVQVNGGVSPTAHSGHAAATATMIAHKGHGELTLLPSPAILEHRATAQAIAADRAVAGVLESASRADALLFSVGVADADSALVHSGYLRATDMESLVDRGAVGDIVGRIIDRNGSVVDDDLDARTIGLDLDALRAADTSILAAGGVGKHDVVRAAVVSGLCTVLVTDEATARYLLTTRAPSEDTR